MKGKATSAQIRKIFASAKENGMDDDLLHLHIHTVVKKDSIQKLTQMEAVLVIDSLEGRADAGTCKTPASFKQKGYILGLAKELGWTDGQGKPDYGRLNGFLSERFRIDRFEWLTRSAACKVIEAMKDMKKRKEGKEHDKVCRPERT